MDKVLEQRVVFFDEFLKAFEKYLKIDEEQSAKYKNEYKKTHTIEVENITPNLLEIFKYFKKFKVFNKHLATVLNFDISGFEKCMFILSFFYKDSLMYKKTN